MFCQRFSQALNDSGKSRRELTELTGVSAASISQYIAGKVVPSATTRRKLARALMVPEDYFEDDLAGIPSTVRGSATISAADAADLLGISYDTLTRGLREKIFPWGYAVPPKPGRQQWKYIIIRAKLEADLKAEVTA